MDVYRRLRTLRWVAFAVPTAVLALVVCLWRNLFPTTPWAALVAEVGSIAAGSYVFSMWLFRLLRTLQADILDKNSQLEALNEAAISISSELSLDAVLQQVVERARRVARARFAALRVLPVDGEPAHFLYAGITPEERARMGPEPCGRGVLGVIQETGRALRLKEIRSHPASVGFPPGHPDMHTFLGVPILSRRTVLGVLYLTEKEGAPEFTAADEEAVTLLANQAAVAIQNARLFEKERRTAQYLKRLLQTSQDAIVVLACDGTVRFWNQGAESLYGYPAAEAIGRVLPMVPVPDRPAVLERLRAVTQGEAVPSQEAYHQRKDGSLVPVLAALSPLPAACGDEGGVLLTVKDLTAQKRLEAQRRRLALLEERERIGMDLHDGSIQSLYAVGLTLETARRLLPQGAEEAAVRLAQAIGQLNAVIQDLRRYILGQGSPCGAERPVEELLVSMARRLEEQDALHVTVDLQPGVSHLLPPDVSPHVAHILGEAVSNVLRHSQARHVAFGLRREGEAIVLTVRDDGRGFDVAAAQEDGHFGLRNMQVRAALLGGECRVRSAPGSGTVVEVRVPVEVEVVGRV
ncbi:PAS domain S-box protein [Caldinitratiruptor microaerophilus]|uniref:histidine kinase n=1 Tax=Caldinitratiruptor microaerophilus TaxID=671077 RepID=A0AA35G9K8_9FIRM|nr:PAS domain S-box protein [Caldinitratiruptor microaerophilus]BDG62196.1 histidine kinase [Caldinitratiruptor microaerophilus]